MNIQKFLTDLDIDKRNWYLKGKENNILFTYIKEIDLTLLISSNSLSTVNITFELDKNTGNSTEQRSYTLDINQMQPLLDKVVENFVNEKRETTTFDPVLANKIVPVVNSFLQDNSINDYEIIKEKTSYDDYFDIILKKDRQKIFIRIAQTAHMFKKNTLSALEIFKLGVAAEQEDKKIYYEQVFTRYQLENYKVLKDMLQLKSATNTEEEFLRSLLTFSNNEVVTKVQAFLLNEILDQKHQAKKRKI